MTLAHPVVSITGSSGAGTSTARRALETLAARQGWAGAWIDGDAFHATDRATTARRMAEARRHGEDFSLFAPEANLIGRLEVLLEGYGRDGQGRSRSYLHTEAEAEAAGQAAGTFTAWARLPVPTDFLCYEGLHGALVTPEHDIPRHVDLLLGVTPIINLEWIQKIARDSLERNGDPDGVSATILRRLPDYIHHIVPQFSRTDVNFQRVPLVDTANPFAAQPVPAPHESLVVVHFPPTSRLVTDRAGGVAAIAGRLRNLAEPVRLTRPDTLVVSGLDYEQAVHAVVGPALARLVEAGRTLRQGRGRARGAAAGAAPAKAPAPAAPGADEDPLATSLGYLA